jgi:hypothetical protein
MTSSNVVSPNGGPFSFPPANPAQPKGFATRARRPLCPGCALSSARRARPATREPAPDGQDSLVLSRPIETKTLRTRAQPVFAPFPGRPDRSTPGLLSGPVAVAPRCARRRVSQHALQVSLPSHSERIALLIEPSPDALNGTPDAPDLRQTANSVIDKSRPLIIIWLRNDNKGPLACKPRRSLT